VARSSLPCGNIDPLGVTGTPVIDDSTEATGNTLGAATWSDGEAVLRLAPDQHRSEDKKDFFAPSDWQALDARDADVGGTKYWAHVRPRMTKLEHAS
jgi:hypothetical protein